MRNEIIMPIIVKSRIGNASEFSSASGIISRNAVASSTPAAKLTRKLVVSFLRSMVKAMVKIPTNEIALMNKLAMMMAKSGFTVVMKRYYTSINFLYNDYLCKKRIIIEEIN